MNPRSLLAVLALAGPAGAGGGIVINEIHNSNAGGSPFDAGEFIELLLTTDHTAAQLDGLAFGDSSSATAAKVGHFVLGDLSGISPWFPAGTMIVLSGADLAADTAYAPRPGINPGNHAAWNLVLPAGGGYFSANQDYPFSSFALSGSGDVVWVDDDDSGSTDFQVIHAIAYDATPGVFAAAGGNVVHVTAIPTLASGEGIALIGGAERVLDATAYARTAAGTPGLPQAGGNAAFVQTLRSPELAERAWVVETQAEFATTGDINGDGSADLLLVDRATGGLRVGLAQGDGSVVFGAMLPSGVRDVTSVTFGDFGGGRRGVAVANPETNAVVVVVPGAINSPFPTNGIGPRLVAALDGGPFAPGGDLVSITSLNDPPDSERMEGWIAQLPVPVDATLEAPNQSAPGGRFAFLARGSGDAGSDELISLASAFSYDPLRLPIPAGAEWFSVYEPHDPGVTWFVIWIPNLLDLVMWRVNGATIESQLSAALPAPAALAVPLEPTGGVARFLVVYSGGMAAEIFAFDGTSSLQSVQSIPAPAGTAWSSASSVGNGLALLGGAGPGSRSGTVRIYGPDGQGTYRLLGAPSAIPALPARDTGNVFAMDGEIFVDANAAFLAVMRAEDWASHPTGLPATIQVMAERFVGGTIGLSAPLIRSFPPPAGGLFAATNQLAPDISMSSGTGAIGLLGPSPRFSPAPGRYPPRNPLLDDDALPVAIEGSPLASIRYRTSSEGPWQNYQGPVPIRMDTILEAFVDDGDGRRSPIVRASYAFGDGTPATLGDSDRDGDGLGDAWEKAFAVDTPGGDADADGATNREEHDAGTDPLDPVSRPNVTAGNVSVTISSIATQPVGGSLSEVVLKVQGPPGTRVRIEASNSLEAPWARITPPNGLIIPPGGSVEFPHSGIDGERVFYRHGIESGP